MTLPHCQWKRQRGQVQVVVVQQLLWFESTPVQGSPGRNGLKWNDRGPMSNIISYNAVVREPSMHGEYNYRLLFRVRIILTLSQIHCRLPGVVYSAHVDQYFRKVCPHDVSPAPLSRVHCNRMQQWSTVTCPGRRRGAPYFPAMGGQVGLIQIAGPVRTKL